MFENPRRDRQATNFGKNVLKIVDLKSSSEQIFSESCRWVPLHLGNILGDQTKPWRILVYKSFVLQHDMKMVLYSLCTEY